MNGGYDSGHEPESPTKPNTPTKEGPAPIAAKKQLSDAQKASLARAREKARQSKLAKSQAKAEQEKQFTQFQQAASKEVATKPVSPVKDGDDDSMDDSQSSPSPSPVKHKKGQRTKRHMKKKRRHETSSNSESSEEDAADAKARVADHTALARQVYENSMQRIKGEVVYKSLFPYLQG